MVIKNNMIKATVNYDKKTMLAFMRFVVIDKPWKFIGYVLSFILSLFLMLVNIGGDYFKTFAILFGFVCVAVGFAVFAYFINPLIKLKNFTDENVVENTFSFDEDRVRFSSKSKKRSTNSELPYNVFSRIDESKTTFYLFINKSSALIITKSGITDGDEKELRKFLNSKITNKKINKLSKK